MKTWSMALIVLALLLAACGAAGNNDDSQSGAQEASAAAPTRPIGSAGEERPTPGAPVEQPAPTGENGAGLLATPQAVEASSLASHMINTEVAGQGGRIGQVLGMVMDASTSQARYLLVRTLGLDVERTVLLPMGAYQVALAGPEIAADGGNTLPVVWLTVPDGDLAAAPEVDPGIFESTEELLAGWDEEAVQYWAGKVEPLPVTGDEGARQAPGSLIYLSGSLVENFDVPVEDVEGARAGHVLDFVVGPGGEVTFAEVETGAAGQAVAVSTGALNWDAERRAYVLTGTPEQLEAAPLFDPAQLPDMTIPGWDAPWNKYWQQQGEVSAAAVPTAGGEQQVKLSQLIGLPVFDVTNGSLGEVEDAILGQSGGILYLVVRAGDLLRPVPWPDFEFDFSQGILTYLDDVGRLQQAPGYRTLDEIDTGQPAWDEQIRVFWGQQR